LWRLARTLTPGDTSPRDALSIALLQRGSGVFRINSKLESHLRPAVEADRDFLYELHCTTMREVIEKTWGWDDAWQQADFSRKLSACDVSIIEADGQPAGCLWLDSKPESLHIVELQILPELQGKGLGTATVMTVINDGASRGVPVTLSVVPANPRAKQLYERLGFEVTGVDDPFIHMRRAMTVGSPLQDWQNPIVDRAGRLRAVVPFDSLLEAFEFVSFAPPEEHQAFICVETGRIYWHSELGDDAEELPEDIDDAEKYVAIPHKNDLDLGKNLAIDFVEEYLPDEVNDVTRMFSRRGAYSNFKNLLERRGFLPRWYEYETAAQEKALREWCADQGIEIGVPGT
jgi:ribosomal protein S18 acetylase RimI-like enzyme